MKKLYLLSCLILAGTTLSAQETQLFTDSFIDNRNNWRLNKKKPEVTIDRGYRVNNPTPNNFVAFQTIPLKPDKDFRITVNVTAALLDEYYKIPRDKRFGYCGIIFGAKDEMNGFYVVLSDNLKLKIFKLTNGREELLYDKFEKCTEEFSVVSENNRWKILTKYNSEITSVAAAPFMGDKIGIFISDMQKWTINSFSVFEKEKGVTVKKREFPSALFMASYKELLCSAVNLFKDDVGAPLGQAKDSTFRCKKLLSGMNIRSELAVIKHQLEYATGEYFDNRAEAMNYYDDLKNAVSGITTKCMTLIRNNYIIKSELIEHVEQYDNWSRNFYNSQVGDVSANVLILTRAEGAGYNVELHLILKHNTNWMPQPGK
jgi:hypothetical protein